MLICGVDEVGRGPLIGDVVACAVILDLSNPIAGLADSKKLSEKKREKLAKEIQEKALAWAIGRCSPAEIDEINILHASMLAMQRAVSGLVVQPELVLVDGNKTPDIAYPCRAIVKGDQTEAAISAASILAKVVRDGEMVELAKRYPGYGIERHKGYGTKEHMDAIHRLGVTPEHRRSFSPVAVALGLRERE